LPFSARRAAVKCYAWTADGSFLDGHMRRRNFISLLGSTMVMGSLTAHAQQSGGMRRIGVLMSHPETDPDTRAFLAAFREGLQKLGWIEGRNLRFDTRWTSPGDVEQMQRLAKELVALGHTTTAATALQKQTRTIPIIFAFVSDPVGSGLLPSSGRQRHRFHGYGADNGRQVAGAAQRDCAARHSGRAFV